MKVSKSIIFLVKSFLGHFYRHMAIFFWSHWLWFSWKSGIFPHQRSTVWIQWQSLHRTLFTINSIEKTKIKETEAGNGPCFNKLNLTFRMMSIAVKISSIIKGTNCGGCEGKKCGQTASVVSCWKQHIDVKNDPSRYGAGIRTHVLLNMSNPQ